MDLLERRDAGVPLEQGRRRPAQLDGPRIESPDRIDDRMVMRVDQKPLVTGVSRDVDLRDRFCMMLLITGSGL